MKQKTNRLHFSTRTLAMVLSIVMLIGSIATGSMLNTFAAYLKDAAANSDAVSQAASEGSDIAQSAIPSDDAAAQADNEDKPDLSGFEESPIVRELKQHLADTGAAVDLADEGASYYLLYRRDNTKSLGSGMTVVQMSASGSSYTASFTSNGENFALGFNTSNSNNSTLVTSTWSVSKSGAIEWAHVEDNGGTYFINGWAANGTTINVTYNGGTSVTLSTGSSGGGSCSTDKTYIVTGDNAITGTNGWSNTSTANKLTYDSTLKCYRKTYTISYTSSFLWRIVESGSWATTWGKDRSNEVDQSNICTYEAGSSDNNIKMTLSQKANVDIRFDDSKEDTSAITVIVTPYNSTVTTAVSPASSGTATVNGGSSASNITYGGSVSLAATPAANYHFSSWSTDNSNISFASTTTASTTATVRASGTVTATFVKDNFIVTKGTGTGYTITSPTAKNTTKAWDETLSITATADDTHYIDYLYYKVNDAGSEVKIGSNAAANSSTLTRTLTVPTNNVTVYASVHEKANNTINYGVCSGQTSYGYVSVGEQYSTNASTMKHTIDSNTKVLEGTKVNFCARPASGYYFVGWYDTSAATGGTLLNSSQDYTVTSPSGNYYARFASLSASSGVRLLIKSDANATMHFWNVSSSATGNISDTNWDSRPKISSYNSSVIIDGSEYYMFNTSDTSFNFLLRNSGNSAQTGDQTISAAGTYVYDYDNSSTLTSKTKWTSFNWYYPINYYVTNPAKGSSTDRAPQFGKAGASVTFYHTPADTSNWKTNRTTTSFGGTNLTDSKTTDASTEMTMPSTYSSMPTFTATFIEKEYYKVTFKAGDGGTVSAEADGTTISSGTMVQEGKTVTITANPSSGYSFKDWTGSGTGSGTTRTISSIAANADVKAYFTRSMGTENTNTYFGYGTDKDPINWTITTTYVRDGHVWAYIPSVSSSNTYYIGAYEENPDSTEKLSTKMYYYNNTGKVWGSTEFSNSVTNIGRDDTKEYGGKYCSEVKFNVTSDVKALIIDLGKDDGSGNAQTHLADSNHNFKENNYRIIPVFNTDNSKVSIYAKDASLRGNSDYDYLPGIADTVVSGSISGRVQHDEFETAVASKGDSITVTTTIDANHRSTYYVRGFSFNGATPALLESNASSGVYTQTYTIPSDFDYEYLEITPIYAPITENKVLFYIENYNKELEASGWGNTLAVYPYYQNASGGYAATKHNAFGGYPGQPVIYIGGRRFIEIPTTYTTLTVDGATEDCTIKGVTLSNDYFDIVHRDYCREVDDHLQTYDYDDFYKIYKETSDHKEVNQLNPGSSTDPRYGTADQITFAFKYRTSINNFSDSSNTTSYSNTGNTVKAPYTSFTTAEKTSKFTNGWEPLLDYHDRPIDLFGKQLTTAEQAKEPLLVVSDDYAINYVGRYATTWTVYRKNGSNYEKIAEIAPSALIVTSAERLADGSPYPAVADQEGYPSQPKLSSFTSAYNSLKDYAGYPVQITYEQAIRNRSSYEKYWTMSGHNSDVAKRSDGRWYYSYDGEEINANLRIEYSDDGGENYTSDTFKSGTNTGVKTGASVQFTNHISDSDGPYELAGLHDTEDYDRTVYSDNNHYYKFAATAGTGYIFAGWWFERDGIVTNVNEDLTQLDGKSQMTSNATFVARYVKNPAAHLSIKHTVNTASSGGGTTYVGVQAIKGNSTTWLTDPTGDHYVENGFSIEDAAYTSYGSGYTFRIYLKTVPDDFSNFNRFTSEPDESADYFSTTNQSTSDGATITYFDIPVEDLFEIEDSFPVQQFDTVQYYSTLDVKELNYNFNYTYPAYLSKYGTQAYRVTGTFDYDTLNKDMVMSGGNLQFKDDDTKTAVFNRLAPYEDNFMQEITWDTTAGTSFSDNTISATIPAVYDDSAKKIPLSFEFNYATTNGNTGYVNADTTYLDDENTVTVAVPDTDWPEHLHTFQPTAGSYVTAPQSLTADGKNYIFRYWSVTTVPDSKHDAVEYTRCYCNEFNYALFQKSIVKTVYTEQATLPGTDTYDSNDVYDEHAQQNADIANSGITISFIENSRNQYNNGQSGTGMTPSRAEQGDRMYTDFLMSYNGAAFDEESGEIQQLNEWCAGKKKAGLIIEVVGEIDLVDGKRVTKTETQYKTEYGANITEIGSKLSGKDTEVNQLDRLKDKIKGTSTSDPAGNITGAVSEFDVSQLDNKNRIQYFYSLANRSHSDLNTVLNNRNYVYRAYAYICDNDHTNIQISPTPVYFTIYDMASIQNFAEAQATGGIQ